MPAVSLVVPVHNEAARMWSNAVALRRHMKRIGEPFEMIIVENGSVDDTPIVAEALSTRFREIKCLTLPEASLGDALKLGIGAASGEKVLYYPLDLSIGLDFIHKSIRLLDEYDLVVASKRLGEDHRPFLRRLTSITYHRLVRLLYGTQLSDTTCAKAYRKSAVSSLLGGLTGASRVFETELLVEAERRGMRIIEVPVSVVERRRSRETLLKKVETKFEDLLSARLDRFSLLSGAPLMIFGSAWLVVLGFEKLGSPLSGFMNPYSFIAAVLLVLGGFQITTFGLLSRLMLQVRKEVAVSASRLDEADNLPVGYSKEEYDGDRD
ncbi:TPA: glycosyltransferase [Candidatus Bathyarchaeota archaeon]|nr:glycosyltransferase [Candidatus Bathyarchaeota archaeon]